jgi:phosphoribosylaminoimidazole-succinocarboxamide synthase
MTKDEIGKNLKNVFAGIEEADLPRGLTRIRGKVRDIVDFKNEYVLVTTDRISAFDRVLAHIPFKGQILNQLSMYWFRETTDIIPNHIEEEITGRTVLVKKCEVLPVEVVIRAYLTGSAWRDYSSTGTVSGITLPEGMRFNQRFDTPLLTPSHKAERGDHDEPVSSEELVNRGIVEKGLWNKIREAAFALFKRGSEIAADRGLILVDTKYEFGLLDGELVLVDELHTPDSSRYWFADTYQELFEKEEKQRKIDKEYLRQWLMEQDYMGDGEPPEIPDWVRVEVADRYIRAYELITGNRFVPTHADPRAEKKEILDYLRSLK